MPGAVAIYEDDAGIRTVLLDLVEMEGFDVLVCSSVFELHQAAIAGARVAIADSSERCPDDTDQRASLGNYRNSGRTRLGGATNKAVRCRRAIAVPASVCHLSCNSAQPTAAV